MKVSIVTISFNQARFLEEALRSVIEQNYGDIEYIVVDPGSTDGSREIIERHRNELSSVILEPDGGPADGLNKGFAAAHGEVYGFLNSDDVLEPGAIARVARFFEANPKVDVVSGNSWIIDAEGSTRRRIYSDRYSLRMAAYGASILAQSSTFFRSEVFRKVGGFNTSNRLSWDGDLFVDMALAGAHFSRVSEFWSRFRVYGESITGSGAAGVRDHASKVSRFKRVKGHEPGPFYPFIEYFARYARKMLNPLDTLERLIRGPVVQRSPKRRA
jgi:glycosyltransferase involved in cell wall biosynthesis